MPIKHERRKSLPNLSFKVDIDTTKMTGTQDMVNLSRITGIFLKVCDVVLSIGKLLFGYLETRREILVNLVIIYQQEERIPNLRFVDSLDRMFLSETSATLFSIKY